MASGHNGQMQQHAKFFDHLVDLVPAQIYHHAEHEVVNPKYLKKGALVAHKQAVKQQRKQNKRNKLHPDKAMTALGMQKQKAAEAAARQVGDAMEASAGEGATMEQLAEAAGPGSSAAAAAPEGPAKTLMLPSRAPASHGELHERLQKRLELLRVQRHAPEADSSQAKRRDTKPGKAGKQKKQIKQKQGQEPGAPAQPQGEAAAAKAWRNQQLAAPKHPTKRKAEEAPAAAAAKRPKAQQRAQQQQQQGEAADLAFSKIDLGDGKRLGKQGRTERKPKKEQLLADAEQKKQRREEQGGFAEGQEQMQQEDWSAALQRARGEKVLDDPKRIRIALKKERKAKEKRGKEWKQRQQRQRQDTAAKQQKRKGNIQARADTKLAKRKEKREKKLMRAGFEGRRATPINT